MFNYIHDKALAIIYAIKDFSIEFFDFMSNPIVVADVTIFESGFDLLGMTALTAVLIRAIKSVLPELG